MSRVQRILLTLSMASLVTAGIIALTAPVPARGAVATAARVTQVQSSAQATAGEYTAKSAFYAQAQEKAYADQLVLGAKMAVEAINYQNQLKAKAAAAAAAAAAAQQAAQQAAYVPTASSASGVLTPAEVGALWLEAGGPASAEAEAECIADHESGDNPNENNYTDNGGTQTSWGLFQVSNGTHAEFVANIDDPLVNTEIAVQKFDDEGDSFLPDWPTAYDCGQ